MSSSLWAMSVIVALGGGPYGCPTCNQGSAVGYAPVASFGGYGGYGSGVTGGGVYSTGMGLNAYSGSNGDTLLPFDSQEAWMHGYFQEIGAYPGYHYFRPYNYKHVLSQADLAYRWGQPHGMPYSQQWWHRYQNRAALNPAQQVQMSQAQSAYELEMARLRAWQDYHAEQARMAAQAHPTFAAPPVPQNMASPMVIDPATPAGLEQRAGSRAYVIPASPAANIPRSPEPPMIPEFQPTYAPAGPNLR